MSFCSVSPKQVHIDEVKVLRQKHYLHFAKKFTIISFFRNLDVSIYSLAIFLTIVDEANFLVAWHEPNAFGISINEKTLDDPLLIAREEGVYFLWPSCFIVSHFLLNIWHLFIDY